MRPEEIDPINLRSEVSGSWAHIDLLDSAWKLFQKLQPRWERYDSIISDETSARLLSLAAKKVGDAARHRQGLPSLTVHFVVAGREFGPIRQMAVSEFLRRHKGRLGRPLIVSEFMASGQGLATLTNLCLEARIDPEIAVLSMTSRKETYPPIVRDRLIFGGVNNSGLGMYRRSDNGIKQGRPELYHPVRDRLASRSEVLAARRSVKLVAERFIASLDQTR